MRVLIASVGSLGDALPYVRLGVALRARGHSVRIFTNADHSSLVNDQGLELATPGKLISSEKLAQDPLLWHRTRGMGVLWRNMLLPSIAPLYHEIERMRDEDASLRVLAGPHMMGARLAQISLGVPLLSLYTSPYMLRTSIAPTTLTYLRFPRGTPSWLLRQAWRWIDTHKLDPMLRPGLTRVCNSLSLDAPSASESLFGQWVHSPQGGITLYPEWFARIPSDHVAPAINGAFPVWPSHDPVNLTQLDPALAEFLDAGPAPVVVMLGTAMAHAHSSYAAWARALDAAGMRSVFLSTSPEQLPPASTQRFTGQFAPFKHLLPRCSALVHHGGIGSAIEALCARIPQLIEARAHDQFENARCLTALGVARRIAPGASTRQRLQSLRHIRELAKASQRLPQDAGLDALCALIEAHPAFKRLPGPTIQL